MWTSNDLTLFSVLFFYCPRRGGLRMKSAENKSESPFDVAQRQVDIVADHLNVDRDLLEKLKQTKRDLIVHFPVKITL